jgi:hypothetical protein
MSDYNDQDVDTIEEITNEEEVAFEKLKAELLVDDDRAEFEGSKTLPIPYAFGVGVVNISGILYLKDRVEDSYTKGIFTGIVVGTYSLSRNKTEACANNGLIKGCVRLDLAGRALYCRACNRDWRGRWKCGSWKKVISF